MRKKDFSPTLEKKRISPVTVTAIVMLLVIGGFGVWQGKNLYNWFQKQRALSYVDDIYIYIEDKAWGRGYARTIGAYRIAPEEPEVLRAASRFFAASGMSSPHSFLVMLEELGEANLEDRKMLADAYLKGGDIEAARLLNDELIEEAPEDVEILALQVNLFRLQRDHREAEALLDKLVELNPGNIDARLLVSKLLVRSNEPDERERGWRDIWEIAETPEDLGIEALELLLSADPFKSEKESKLAEILEAHPLATEEHQLKALERRIAIEPDRRGEFIAEAMEKRSDWSIHEITPFYSWLSNEEEYGIILDNLTIETARTSGTILPVFLFALGHDGRWEEVKEILKDLSLPMAPGRHSIFNALASQKLGEDSAKTESHLREAQRTAKRHGSSSEALNTGVYAEDFGLNEFAEMAYEMALQSDDLAGKAYVGLMRLAEKSGDTLKLRAIAERFRRRFPDPGHTKLIELNNYLNALTGVGVERALHESELLLEESPLKVSPRITAALACYRMGDMRRAAQFCQPCKIEELSVGQRAVYAAVAGNSDQVDTAKQISREISRATMLTEERALISEWVSNIADTDEVLGRLAIQSPGASITENLLLDGTGYESSGENRQQISLLAFLAETDLLLYSGRGEDALAYLRKAISANPSEIRLQVALARLQNKLGNYRAAIEEADKAIRMDPEHAEAYMHRGEAHASLRIFSDAADDYEQATLRKPENADYTLRLAELLRLAGKENKAVDVLNLALAVHENSEEVPAISALILIELGRHDDAIARCEEVLAANASDAYAAAILGRAYHKKKMIKEAHVAFDKATQLDMNDHRPWVFAADLFETTGRPDEAGIAHGEVLRRQPENRDSREALLRLSTDAGQLDVANYHQGFLAYSAGDKETALEHYREALEINPRLKPALHDLALIYLRDNQPGLAETTAMEALHLGGQDALAWSILGQAIYAQDDAWGATQAYEKAIEISPDDPSVLYLSAVAYLKIGDEDRATERLNSALESGRPFAQESEARRLVEQLVGTTEPN